MKIRQGGEGLEGLRSRIKEIGSRADLSRVDWKSIGKEMKELNQIDRLRGVDRFGRPLPPVVYRPRGTVDRSRANAPARPKYSASNNYGNLDPAEYRRLDGKRLVPRGKASRVISNYFVELGSEKNKWRLNAGWDRILDRQGRPLLPYHLTGAGRNPKCDIAGLSRNAVRRIRTLIEREIGR